MATSSSCPTNSTVSTTSPPPTPCSLEETLTYPPPFSKIGDPANVSGISSIKEFDLEAWLSHHPTSRVDPIMTSVIHTMRSEMGVKRLGAVGYCFGGKYTCRFLKPGFIDVGFTAHPSFVLPEELRAIQGPLSIAAAEKDEIMDEAKRRETEDILKEMDVRYQVTLYGDVGHGFAVRGDLKNQASRFAKEAAFYQAVMWFEEFLKE
ncbi:hypothetical protein MMC14_004756 [Varicellaria rhodocarpa]|nr:hypothetical protein [Varicellaria rhodocarpa]